MGQIPHGARPRGGPKFEAQFAFEVIENDAGTVLGMDRPPSPVGATTVAELITRLRSLRVWAGMPYRQVHREIVRSRKARGIPERPSFNTVYRCFEIDRTRLDMDLVVDVARVLHGDGAAEQWRAAYQAMLGNATTSTVVTVADSWPADRSPFIGRTHELTKITALANTGGVVCIAGMPGVGKTRLAVRAGQLLRACHPKGSIQLVADLRGHHPDGPPADPAAVLAGMLRRLGVSGGALAADRGLASYRQQLRSLLSDKQAVVLLDDAVDAEQVEPLLVDVPGCVTLITSRQAMPRPNAALHFSLDVLSVDEALDLLDLTSGTNSIRAERAIATEIAQSVGRLPLGLALAAARIRAYPQWTLADHMSRLDTLRARLQLDDQLETAISLSYQVLDAPLQRLIRLLSVHPGRDFDVLAASALTDQEPVVTERQMHTLAGHHLIQYGQPGRYRIHDVIRIYARGRCEDEEPASRRRAALARLAEYYLAAAVTAANVLTPAWRHRRPNCTTKWLPTVDDQAQALAWMENERANLLAAATAEDAVAAGLVPQFSAALDDFLTMGAYYTDALLLHGRAVESARTLKDTSQLGNSLNHLGKAHIVGGTLDDAHRHLHAALDVAIEDGDAELQCRTHNNLAVVAGSRADYPAAIEHLRAALELAEQTGDTASQGRALCNLGNVVQRLGKYREAERYIGEVIAIAQAHDDPDLSGQALAARGRVRLKAQRPAGADEDFQRSLDIAQKTGNRTLAVEAHTGLADSARQAGKPGRAADHDAHAARIAEEIGLNIDHLRTS